MKIVPSKKIIPEDFPPEGRELIKRISQVINPFLDQITQALTNSVTLKDNLKCKVIESKLAVDTYALKLPWDMNEKPTAVFIGQITKNNKEKVTQVYSISWLYVDGKIEISFIGLPAATPHDVTIIAIV
jgi:hypothetical protein